MKNSSSTSRPVIYLEYGTSKVLTSRIPALISDALLAEKINKPITVTGIRKNYKKNSKLYKRSDVDTDVSAKDMKLISKHINDLMPIKFPMKEVVWAKYEDAFNEASKRLTWEIVPIYCNPKAEAEVEREYIEGEHTLLVDKAIQDGKLIQKNSLTSIPTKNRQSDAFVTLESFENYVSQFGIYVQVSSVNVSRGGESETKSYRDLVISTANNLIDADRARGEKRVGLNAYCKQVASELKNAERPNPSGKYLSWSTIKREYLQGQWWSANK